MSREESLQQLHAQFGLPERVVADLAERATGSQVVAVERLVAGDEYEVHAAELTTGAVVYARICRPGMPAGKAAREAWAMDRARAGGVPVPEVLALEDVTDQDQVRQAMVLTTAPGRQLATVLPSLTAGQRSTVWSDLGRVLGQLHTVPMPGPGRPDPHGDWPDPETIRGTYLTAVTTDCEHLTAIGLTTGEIDRIRAVLAGSVEVLFGSDPVLCHGDISPVHVFVDTELQVCGLIDWGMWWAGTAIAELANIAMRNDPADLTAIAAAHPAGQIDATAFRRAIALPAIPQTVAELAWNVTSGQTDNAKTLTPTLRQALNEIDARA